MVENVQSISMDIIKVSLTVLGLSFGLIALTWKAFEQKFLLLCRVQRVALIKALFYLLIPILIVTGLFTLIGSAWPDSFPDSSFLILLGLGVISLIYLIIVGLKKLVLYFLKKRQKPVPVKVDESTTLYGISLCFLIISILTSLGAITGVTLTALSIKAGPYQSEYYNLSKWLISDGILFLISGTLGSGFSYFFERTQIWKKTTNN